MEETDFIIYLELRLTASTIDWSPILLPKAMLLYIGSLIITDVREIEYLVQSPLKIKWKSWDAHFLKAEGERTIVCTM